MKTVQDALAADLDDGFRRLVESTRDRVYSFALSLTRSGHDAEDVAQDTYVRAYRALKGYSSARIRELRVRPWLAKITLNVWRNRMRGRRPENAPLDERLPADPDQGPHASAERAESSARLRASLSRLPERYRLAILMRYTYDLPYGEAAAALAIPVGTLKANVHRGVRLLRETWTASDFEPILQGQAKRAHRARRTNRGARGARR